ncbi:MAG: histidine phosphatase family protein [bacterium]|nr:histidine phosphatase family protein [bacterium]
MVLKLYYIRHAQCAMNLEVSQTIGGRTNDSPLTRLGEEQSDLLGQRFALEGIHFDEVYSSPAVRARKTAEKSTRFVEFPSNRITLVDALQELDQGEWEGRSRPEVYSPEMLAHINSDNWNFCPPGGESQKQVERRQMDWVQDLLTRSRKDLTVCIYGHGVALSCFLRGVLGFYPSLTYKIRHWNTGVTRLDYAENGWHVLCVNDSAHLPLAKKS